jgi:hypothetical protein
LWGGGGGGGGAPPPPPKPPKPQSPIPETKQFDFYLKLLKNFKIAV